MCHTTAHRHTTRYISQTRANTEHTQRERSALSCSSACILKDLFDHCNRSITATFDHRVQCIVDGKRLQEDGKRLQEEDTTQPSHDVTRH